MDRLRGSTVFCLVPFLRSRPCNLWKATGPRLIHSLRLCIQSDWKMIGVVQEEKGCDSDLTSSGEAMRTGSSM